MGKKKKRSALVQGSSSKPYRIEITIAPLSMKVWQTIVKECSGKINSLQELAAGKFPRGLSELFTTKGKGLFPAPKEIQFFCSCPDSARMCKHVAAVLYGIGARFDDQSALLFELRNVKMDELITASLAEQTKAMLNTGGRRSRRVMETDDLAGTFGIDLDVADSVVSKPRRGRPPKK